MALEQAGDARLIGTAPPTLGSYAERRDDAACRVDACAIAGRVAVVDEAEIENRVAVAAQIRERLHFFFPGLRRATARCGCALVSASSTVCPRCTWRTPARSSTSRRRSCCAKRAVPENGWPGAAPQSPSRAGAIPPAGCGPARRARAARA